MSAENEKELNERFCTECGTKMIHRSIVHSYDSKSGKPLLGNIWKCPNMRWFRLNHDSYNDFTVYCDFV